MRILVVGDTHGNSNAIKVACQDAQYHNCEVIFQLGDFAAFGASRDRFLMDCERFLAENNKILCFIDGNHDDHPALRSLPVDAGAYQFAQVSNHMFYVPRGTHWNWDGVRFCGIGGAFSIDKDARVEGINWFPEETIRLSEIYKACQDGEVDIMFTHDGPYGAPSIKGEWRLSSGMQTASDNNRKLLRQAVESLKPILLLHGHHHHYYEHDLIRTDDKGTTHVIGLSLELHANSMYVVDLNYFKKAHSIGE